MRHTECFNCVVAVEVATGDAGVGVRTEGNHPERVAGTWKHVAARPAIGLCAGGADQRVDKLRWARRVWHARWAQFLRWGRREEGSGAGQCARDRRKANEYG